MPDTETTSEQSSEQPQGNPTEASNDYLDQWYSSFTFLTSMATLNAFMAGANLASASGSHELGLVQGIAAGGFTVLAILKEGIIKSKRKS